MPDCMHWYYDGPGPVPKPGQTVTLPDGRQGVVDTAWASEGAIEKRKLTVIVNERSSDG